MECIKCCTFQSVVILGSLTQIGYQLKQSTNKNQDYSKECKIAFHDDLMFKIENHLLTKNDEKKVYFQGSGL